MQKIFKSITIIAALITLNSCVNLKLPKAKTQNFKIKSVKQRSLELEQLKKWEINGAFSIQNKGKINLANYDWKQDKNKYHIEIRSTLNLYSLLIEGRPKKVTLWESRNKPISAISPEELLQKRLGWSIPISNLSYWIKGLAAPELSKEKFDNYGHLISISQQDWQVNFSNYTTINSVDLPCILKINGHGLIIKMVIKNWRILNAVA